MKKVSPALYQALGVFLPLITTNCAILGVAILVIQKDYNLIEKAYLKGALKNGSKVIARIRKKLQKLKQLQDLLAGLTQPGHNGPLVFLLLRPWRTLTGDVEVGLRYPSALFSVLAIPLGILAAQLLRIARC